MKVEKYAVYLKKRRLRIRSLERMFKMDRNDLTFKELLEKVYEKKKLDL